MKKNIRPGRTLISEKFRSSCHTFTVLKPLGPGNTSNVLYDDLKIIRY